MKILTTTLRGRVTVLAKEYKGELCAVTYANRTQAANRVIALRAAGILCDIWHPGVPFYIRIAQPEVKA